MKKTRWFWIPASLATIGIALTQGQWVEILIAFGLGFLGGCMIEVVGMKILHLWRYPRQSKRYLPVIGIAWGFLGVMVNLLWDWMGTPSSITFIILTLGLLLIWEAPNLITKSWQYHAPTWLVILGWFPLVAAFRIAYVTMSMGIP